MEANWVESLTAVSTFATAIVVIGQAREARCRIDVKLDHAYSPDLVIEIFNLSGRRITIKEINYVFRKPLRLLSYMELGVRRFSSFSIEDGDKFENAYSILQGAGGPQKKHDWRDLFRLKIVLANGKRFSFKIPKKVKIFLSANEAYFADSSWSGYSTPSYGEFMEKKTKERIK